jgi:hypothetical protein
LQAAGSACRFSCAYATNSAGSVLKASLVTVAVNFSALLGSIQARFVSYGQRIALATTPAVSPLLGPRLMERGERDASFCPPGAAFHSLMRIPRIGVGGGSIGARSCTTAAKTLVSHATAVGGFSFWRIWCKRGLPHHPPNPLPLRTPFFLVQDPT